MAVYYDADDGMTQRDIEIASERLLTEARDEVLVALGLSRFSQSLGAVRHPVWGRGYESTVISMRAFPTMEDDPDPLAEPENSRITITYPQRWRPSNRRRWASTRIGTDRASHSRTGAGDGVWLEIPERHHGPLVAAGSQFHGRRARPWLRAGYEASWLPFMTHALTAETDLRRWTVVPTTELGTPNLGMLIPAASVGVGVPVRVHPQVRPGARVQAALSWPIVGVVGTFDAFPRMFP